MSQSASDRCANVLGALALAVADQAGDAVEDISGHEASDAAALSALHQFLDRPSIDLLRQVLGLTQSGTVRLVDRLQGKGLVIRGSGVDGRTTAIALTPAGRKAARRVSTARSTVLRESLSVLSPDEVEQLDALLGKVLIGRMRGPGAQRWICRMCDLRACGRADGQCPLANEAQRRWGSR